MDKDDIIWFLNSLGYSFDFKYVMVEKFSHILSLQDLVCYVRQKFKEIQEYQKVLGKDIIEILLDPFNYEQQRIIDGRTILEYWTSWFLSSEFDMKCLYKLIDYFLIEYAKKPVFLQEIYVLTRTERIKRQLRKLWQ